MSRIDEALRHVGESSPRIRTPAARVFESAWTFPSDPGTTASETTRADDAGARRGAPAAGVAVAEPTGYIESSWAPWVVSPEVEPGIVEQFRRLAASLLHGQREGRLKIIMVTSALPGEGKTLTTLNTALVLAGSYKRRVLVIDADLRRPRLTEAAGLAGVEGLGEALKAPEERQVPVEQISDHLWFLPAGRPDPEPLSGLTSSRMQRLLEDAAERYDWVVVDTPPVAAAPDPGLLGAMVDATVLVVKAGNTRLPAVRHAIETIGRDRILGVVLNGVDKEKQDVYAVYRPPEPVS